jgi:hypothetical protein
MDKFKTLAAFAVAAFALLSQAFALTGYVPPVPLDKLLHLSADQIALGAGLVVSFLAPVHSLAADAWKLATSVFHRDNEGANAAYAALLAQVADLQHQIAQLTPAAQPTLVADIPAAIAASVTEARQPAAQSGRAGLAALLLGGILSLVALVGLNACAVAPAPTSQAQTLAYTEGSITAARQAALSLLNAGVITVDQAAHVQADADKGVAAIKLARVATAAGDLSTAQAQLALANQVLAGILAMLPTK